MSKEKQTREQSWLKGAAAMREHLAINWERFGGAASPQRFHGREIAGVIRECEGPKLPPEECALPAQVPS